MIRHDGTSGFGFVDLIGDLQVADPEAFSQTLFNGLGRAKTFGCGVLIVRRYNSNLIQSEFISL
ncbi:MAG: type I-E CRISPR-associated protein Cas6/Cse3/CasE [Methylomicrobium sp.]|nr:type I-E CRISPR-associated protein Cas6/Cse3/CasE [Methylomicrobium sp.]